MAPAPYPSATEIGVGMTAVSSELLTRGVVQERSLFRNSSEKDEFRSENCHDIDASGITHLCSTGVPTPAGEESPAISISLAVLTNPRNTPSTVVSYMGGVSLTNQRRLHEDGVLASHGAIHELSEENSRQVGALLKEEPMKAGKSPLSQELVDHGGR